MKKDYIIENEKTKEKYLFAIKEGHWCRNCGSYFLEYDEDMCQICGKS
jgi:rRNA maturation endonuclease Nob1